MRCMEWRAWLLILTFLGLFGALTLYAFSDDYFPSGLTPHSSVELE